MSRLIAIVFTLLLVTAGVAPVAAAATTAPTDTATATATTTATTSVAAPTIASPVPAHSTHPTPTSASSPSAGSSASTPPDPPITVEQTQSPETDATVGCFDGICHDDELGFETTTNLTDAELDAFVARTMARVEQLRGENFESRVPVETQSRAEFREESILSSSEDAETFNRWNDQVWKALFVVGDDRGSAEAIDATVGGAVNGFYLPSQDRIVVVTATPDSPSISELTLLHELTHALQDQRFDLSEPTYRGQTQDADLAIDGVVEGEAVYLEYLYEDRCRSGAWDCFADPPAQGGGGGGAGSPSNPGLLFLLLQPYSDGPVYIHETVEREGWDGVDDLFADPATTTTEIIHREPVEPTDIADGAEPTGGWERYPGQGRDGAEVTGEASIYIMFWYQARAYNADTIDTGSIRGTNGEYDRYDYVSDPSDGWVADELVPYKQGDDDGYVWRTEWESREDAVEFQRAYGAILTAHDATETDQGAYVVSNGTFSGAYAVDAEGTSVTIVHAPTEADLFELDPSLDPDSVTDGTRPFREQVPGFGIAAALAALVVVVAAGRQLD